MLTTQRNASGLPRILSFRPKTEVTIAAMPLDKAISRASMPRFRQPITLTGVIAIIKKASGMIVESRMGLVFFIVSFLYEFQDQESHRNQITFRISGECLSEAAGIDAGYPRMIGATMRKPSGMPI